VDKFVYGIIKLLLTGEAVGSRKLFIVLHRYKQFFVMSKKIIIKKGEVYNRLQIMKEIDKPNKYHRRYFVCLCDCGNTTSVSLNDLRSGHTKSCGCLNRELSSKRYSKLMLKHGHGKKNNTSKTYHSWCSMKRRCKCKTLKHYRLYGGRGIKICKRWEKFENFLKDMGERPEGKTIDRIDVNGNYEKNNCRWSTAKQQNLNKQKTIKIMYKNNLFTINELSLQINIPESIIRDRLRLKWSVEKIINTPPRKYTGIRN
jgi:hypothetical protein